MKPTAVLLLASSLFLVGCQYLVNDPNYVAPAPPTGLRTSPGDNFIELFWDPGHAGDIAGYNVYRSTSAHGNFVLIGSAKDTYFLDNSAYNGTTYYYAVTAYDYDGNESDLSETVVYDIPRPEGYGVILDDYRISPSYAGYDFSSSLVVPYDDEYADMFFENYNGDLYMDVRTDTDILDAGPTNSILDVDYAPNGGWSPTHDVLLYAGHTYVIHTWDNHFAKFRITGLAPGRVEFDWAYQLQNGTPLLKTASSAAARPPVTAGHARP